MILLPRLNPLAVDMVLEELSSGQTGRRMEERFKELPNAASFAAVGGTPASPENFRQIREPILQVAKQLGYPKPADQKTRAAFDVGATAALMGMDLLHTGETHRDDVWAFIASWLMMDLTHWRFGNVPSRFHGGVRNAFQRLWLRGLCLDRGRDHPDRWELIARLSEDALVQITERPSISARPKLSLALGEGWARCANRIGDGRMEPVMRKAIIGVRLIGEVISLSSLSDSDLAELVDGEFGRAASSVGL